MKSHLLLSALLVSNITMFSVAPTRAQEKACIRTEAGKKVCGTLIKENEAESQSLSTSSSSVNLTFADDYVVNVKLQKCNRKSATVSCRFTVVKTQGDKDERQMRFYASENNYASTVTDTQENEYIANLINIGASNSKGTIPHYVLKSQPFSATLSFKIPSNVEVIKELKFTISGGRKTLAAQFSEIKIQ